MIDRCHGEPRQKRFQVPGTIRTGAIDVYNPGAFSLFIPKVDAKKRFVGFNFRTFKGTGRTGERFLSHPLQNRGEGKLAPHTIAVRFLVAGDEEFIAVPDKIQKSGGYGTGQIYFPETI